MPVSAAMIIFFAVSLALIVATVMFFLNRRDSRRFLTTTRLSVLDMMVQRGCRFIEHNYSDRRLSVDRVCKELVTGQAYLDALFIKELGINTEDFIAQVRVNRMKHILLTDPSKDIEKACVLCGFDDRAAAEPQFSRLAKMTIEDFINSPK